MKSPKTLIVTSCTNKKATIPQLGLTKKNIMDSLKRKSLKSFELPATKMYQGAQHLRLTEGIDFIRKSIGLKGICLDLAIVSAGYGLIDENELILPYSITFNSMGKSEFDEWILELDIHNSFEKKISSYDLIFVLLGEVYLRSLALPVTTRADQTMIFLSSANAAKYLTDINAKYHHFSLSTDDATKYRYGVIGLKGFLFKQFALATTSHAILNRLSDRSLLYSVYDQPESFLNIIDDFRKNG